jgi:hypothetical protein
VERCELFSSLKNEEARIMNKLIFATFTLITCFTLMVISANALAQDARPEPHPDGPIWEVRETNIPQDENLIWVDDTMRLRKAPPDNPIHYMLKPESRLLGRWGQQASYRARLDKSEDDERVFCGEIVIRYGGKKIKHKLALSEIDETNHVTLYFYPPGSHEELDVVEGCSYHKIHGGLAHVHRD